MDERNEAWSCGAEEKKNWSCEHVWAPRTGAAEGAFEANIADAALKLGREERGMVVRAWRKKKWSGEHVWAARAAAVLGNVLRKVILSRETLSRAVSGGFLS